MDRIPYGKDMPEPFPNDLADIIPDVIYTFAIPPAAVPKWIMQAVERRRAEEATIDVVNEEG